MPNCCIGLCVKDSGEGLTRVLNNADEMRKCFDKIKIIVAYDKSGDSSINIIHDYKMNHNDIIVINIGNKDDYPDRHKKHVDRSERIANARNAILDHVYKYHEDWEYFVMMDTNCYSCVTPIDITVLNQCFESNEWDGLSFNRDPYYDVWALSIPPLVLSCWHIYKADKALETYRKYLTDKLKKLQPHEFLPVISAFGGFGIYRVDKFKDCKYSGKFDIKMFSEESIRKNAEILDSKIFLRINDCEHRNFHVAAIRKNAARIMVTPLHLFPRAIEVDRTFFKPQKNEKTEKAQLPLKFH